MGQPVPFVQRQLRPSHIGSSASYSFGDEKFASVDRHLGSLIAVWIAVSRSFGRSVPILYVRPFLS